MKFHLCVRRSGVLGCRNENFEKGSVESTHKVPTSHYHTKHCHAAVVSLGARWERLTSHLRQLSNPWERVLGTCVRPGVAEPDCEPVEG